MSETAQSAALPCYPGFVTPEIAGTGGTIRDHDADFCVEELPLYRPTGEGQHTLFLIEKEGIDTRRAVRDISRVLHTSPRNVGTAGLKDAHAITRQWLSVEGVAPERLFSLDLPHIKVLEAARHRNRLKIGHLKGNRFSIRIRNVEPAALQTAEQVMQILAAKGVQNGFGPQRFGLRGKSHLLGSASIRQDWDAFYHHFLGAPSEDDEPAEKQARSAFDAGDIETALTTWPYRGGEETQALQAWAHGTKPQAIYANLPLSLRRLFAAAYQAHLFNLLLAQRLDEMGTLLDGDLAIKHENGAFFLVEDAAAEQPRADALEISPSAPLYGFKVRLAHGVPGDHEHELMRREGLDEDIWRVGHGVRMPGERRPLRVPLMEEPRVFWDEGIMVQFALPPGAYATNIVREITKEESPGD